MEKPLKYRIYPSLLDKYQSLLEYEQEADTPWNVWTEKKVSEYLAQQKEYNENANFPMATVVPEVGDYILTPDQMYEKIERELIDSINRVSSEPSEAASKGTCLNEVLDCLLLNKPCDREDMEIMSVRNDKGEPYAIEASLDGFSFVYDLNLCRELQRMLKGSVCQYFITADIDTKFGRVQLYGYLDYWLTSHVIDLKTTSKYDFGKYERKWQRYVYPYCCIESGLAKEEEIEDFTYLAVQLGKGKIITGNIYPEVYTYNHEKCKALLKRQVESFIEWLESVRPLITDKKIFNELVEE